MVCVNIEHYLALKEKTNKPWKEMGETWKNTLLNKRRQSENVIDCTISTTWHYEIEETSRDNKRDSGYYEIRKKGMNKQSREDV